MGIAIYNVYSNLFTCVHGNDLRASIAATGLDTESLRKSDPSKMNFTADNDSNIKVWCGLNTNIERLPIACTRPEPDVITSLEQSYFPSTRDFHYV